MKNKFDRIKKAGSSGSLSDQIIQQTEDTSIVDVADFMKCGIKKSSMNYSMMIYEVINHLKVHTKIKGIHQFVNEACRDKLLAEFPEVCNKFWND